MNLGIQFADGNELINYDDDSYYYSGCPTCDYGSEYINDITIITTTYRIKVEFNQMYEYAFSSSDAIKIFAVNIGSMTEDEFIKYIDEAFHKYDALQHFTVRRNQNEN